jgi:hypothetical protein
VGLLLMFIKRKPDFNNACLHSALIKCKPNFDNAGLHSQLFAEQEPNFSDACCRALPYTCHSHAHCH